MKGEKRNKRGKEKFYLSVKTVIVYYSLKTRFRINFGTSEPGIKLRFGGDLFSSVLSLKTRVTLAVKLENGFNKTIITAIWQRILEFLSRHILGLARIQISDFRDLIPIVL